MKRPSYSERFFRFLLRILPFDFQREFGSDMEAVFRQESQAAKGGAARTARLWWTTLTALFCVAPAEHIEVFRRDIHYGVRSLRKSPGFTFVAIVALGIGIGANLTIFGFANALLIRPLPVPNPSEVIRVLHYRWANVEYRAYVQYRDRNQTLSGLAGFAFSLVNFRADVLPESVWAMAVTGNYFETLRVQATQGRTIQEKDDRPGAPGVVMLSDGFWRRRFGGDPSVFGRTVWINGSPFTIVGIIPPSFTTSAPIAPQIWVPCLGMAPLTAPSGFPIHRCDSLIGRLRPGITVEKAQADLSAIAAGVASELGVGRLFLTVYPGRALHPEVLNSVAAFTGLLLALTGLVLLIACLNIAGLLLARSASRRREISVRIALGACRRQLVRQLLTESFLLVAAAGVVAVGLAVALARAVPSIPYPLQLPIVLEFAFDWRVALFGVGLAFGTMLLFGLAPALHAVKTDLVTAMKEGASTSVVRASRLRGAFVVAQLAASTLLLVIAVILVRSLASPQTADRGFTAANVLTASISLPPGFGRERSSEFYDQLLSRLESAPGVLSANIAEQTPLTLSNSGRIYEKENGDVFSVSQNVVSGGHFKTLDIPLLAGRDFSPADRAGAALVCIVNERLAQRMWPGESPVGKRLRERGANSRWIEVIGVARDSKYTTITEDPKLFLYRPLAQQYAPQTSLFLKSKGDPLSLLPQVQAAVRALDPEISVFAVSSLEKATAISLLPARIVAALSGALGIVALLLGAIGIYGVVSYLARNRTREIGIRIALGAQPSQVMRFVTSEMVRWTVAGLVIGLAAALAITIVLRNLIYGVSPGDPVSFLGVACILFAMAFAACWLPARRASRIDPLNALREE
jgi:predicted permease